LTRSRAKRLVIILSGDPGLYASAHPDCDVLQRHRRYLRVMTNLDPKIFLCVLSVIPAGHGNLCLKNPVRYGGLFLRISLYHSVRVISLISILNIIRKLNKRFEITAIAADSPYLTGVVAYTAKVIFKTRFLLQIHFDVTTSYWKSWRSVIRRLLISFACRRADAIRVVSWTTRYGLISRWSISQAKIAVAPIPISSVYFDYDNDAQYVGYSGTFLFVGRLSPEKDPMLFVSIAKTLLQRDDKLKFVLVGDGPLCGAVKKEINRSNLNNSFQLIKNINQIELRKLYKGAAALVVTSKFEGFSRVALESILSGTPVLTTRSGGISDFVIDGVNGMYYVNEWDPIFNDIELLKDFKKRNYELITSSALVLRKRYFPSSCETSIAKFYRS
jgi:glycosyltransferase involved in cell wall biosynthesis